jgi:hypothetical protein
MFDGRSTQVTRLPPSAQLQPFASSTLAKRKYESDIRMRVGRLVRAAALPIVPPRPSFEAVSQGTGRPERRVDQLQKACVQVRTDGMVWDSSTPHTTRSPFVSATCHPPSLSESCEWTRNGLPSQKTQTKIGPSDEKFQHN